MLASLSGAVAPVVKTSPRGLTGQQSSQVKTALQRALDHIGVSTEWIADRLKENAEATRALSYMGKVTGHVPDHGARIKAAEQLLRIRGEYAQAETAVAAVSVEVSIDERRAIQIKAAARLGNWGLSYSEDSEDIGEDSYPAT